MHEILVALADFARVEDRVDRTGDNGGNDIGVEVERFGSGVGMKFGGVVIRFEKRDVENGVKTGEI